MSRWLWAKWPGAKWLGAKWLGAKWLGAKWLGAKWLWAAMIAVMLALPLSACGKRGDLEPPAGADPKFPRQYPTSK